MTDFHLGRIIASRRHQLRRRAFEHTRGMSRGRSNRQLVNPPYAEPLETACPPPKVRIASTPSATVILCVAAVVLFAYQAIAIIGWISDGPHQVTVGRDHATGSWWAARVVELIVVASIGGWIVHVLRERRRTGRLGTDGLLILGMFASGFWDPIYNWVTPAWMYSSNLLNVNDWFAHAPGIDNPDAGTMPWPIIIVLVGYPLWGVGFGAIVDVAMRWSVPRWPGMFGGGAMAVGFAVAVALTAASFSAFKLLGLMRAPGYDLGLPGGELIPMSISGGVVFWAIGLVRHFRDGRARSIVERGQRGLTRFLAAAGLCQIIVVMGWGFLTVPLSLHSVPYPGDLPGHLLNGLCDPPGASVGSDYGPCPGGSGFRLPLPGSR